MPRHPKFELHRNETRLEIRSLQKGATSPGDRTEAMALLNEVISHTTRPIHIGHSTFPVSLTPLAIPHRIQLITVDQDPTVSRYFLSDTVSARMWSGLSKNGACKTIRDSGLIANMLHKCYETDAVLNMHLHRTTVANATC
jgi:hypothetical protein